LNLCKEKKIPPILESNDRKELLAIKTTGKKIPPITESIDRKRAPTNS